MSDFDDLMNDPEDWVKEKKPVNHVIFVLDHSGSMTTITEIAKSSFNEQLQTCKKESHDQDTFVSLIEFSDDAELVYREIPVDDVRELDGYYTDNMTALYDAIGLAVETFRDIPELTEEENHSALVVIITDGNENYSKDFKGESGRVRLKSLIEELKGTGKWTFTFLGAGQDVMETAVEGMSIAAGNSMGFTATKDGYNVANAQVCKGLTSFYSSRRVGAQAVSNFYNDVQDNTNDKEKWTNSNSTEKWTNSNSTVKEDDVQENLT